MVVRKPVRKTTAASHQAPISIAAFATMTFGQKPENGGRPDTAKNSTSDRAANSAERV